MFEDICFTCSRPVDSGVAYCSDECALRDSATTDSSSGLSSGSMSPYLSPYTQPTAAGKLPTRHSADGHVPSFVLHNPHPDYPLPLAHAASPSPKHGPKRTPTMLHIRKPSSVSSSSASSALSTPSAPPLTDDEDSMSDPEFLLDPRVDAPASCPTSAPHARRPSGTGGRAPKPAPGLSSYSSASTSGSAHIVSPAKGSPHGNRTPSRARRPRHAYHLSVPALVEGLNKLFVADDHVRPRLTERPQTFSAEPEDSYRIRGGERESSYATLTKLSVASKCAEIIANPKSRRTPTVSRPRSSLPAYLSLMKLSSPSSQGERSRSPPKKNVLSRPQSLRNLHKSSPTVAHSHETASTATLSASFSRASVRTATASATIAHSLAQNSSSREPSPFVGDRTASPTGSSAETRSPTLRSGSSPRTVAATPKDTAVSHRDVRPFSIKDTLCECEGGCSGTPRGRTRSRSNQPRTRSRSRSRSETRERARRAHFHGTPPTNTRFDASAAFAGRGRPHVRGMAGRAWHGQRREECGQTGRNAEIDWLDAQDAISNTTTTAAAAALTSEPEAEHLRGRRRVPLRA